MPENKSDGLSLNHYASSESLILQQHFHENISTELNSNHKMLNQMLRIVRKEIKSKGHYDNVSIDGSLRL